MVWREGQDGVERREGGSSSPLPAISVLITYLGVTVLLPSVDATLQPPPQAAAKGGTISLCHICNSFVQQVPSPSKAIHVPLSPGIPHPARQMSRVQNTGAQQLVRAV